MSTLAPPVTEQVEARIWEALRHVEDPEIPISVLAMGLIVSVAYDAPRRPATEFIEDDIREALLGDSAIDAVEIEVVWDPVWTKDRIREEARETMRRLGIVV
jgi:metal-sulfur cluster biosynthetic enzyme